MRRRLIPVGALVATIACFGSAGSATGGGQQPRGAPRILYASNWSGTAQIYAVDPAAGSTPGQLTFDRASSYDPSPSPDGRRVVVRGCANGTGFLRVARADGTASRRLPGSARDCYFVGVGAAWSPDSRRIAYTVDGRLRIASADGSPARVVSAAGDGATYLDWSRDGSSLAFQTSVRAGQGELFVLRHGSVKRIAAVDEFAWSPTGKWIAYDSQVTRYGPVALYLVRPDGSGRRRLTPPYYGSRLQWSPDGRYLAFWSAGKGTGIVDLGRGGVRYLPDPTPLGWAPTSQHVLAVSSSDGISLFDLDAGTSRLLTSDHPQEGAQWSPDGRSLAYVVSTSLMPYYSGDLRVVSLDGTVRTIVPAGGDYGGSIADLAWTRPAADARYRPAVPRSVATVSSNQLVAPWTITVLAADGGRVAYVSCGHVFAWTPTSGTVEQVEPVASAAPHCSLGQNYVAYQVYSVAVAGDRVAYAQVQGNMSQSFDLIASRAGSASELTRGMGNAGDPLICSDACSGELVGSGGLLAYSSWGAKYVNGKPAITAQTIQRVDGMNCPCPTLRTDPGPLVPLDADNGRIVAGGDNSTVILDGNGKQLLSVPVVPLAAALSGNELVILRQGELLDLDASTGSQIHRWPLPDVTSGRECGSKYCRPIFTDRPSPGPRLVLEDAAHGLAAYTLDGQVHLLRLADGTDQVVGTGTLARFMDTGLVYVDGARIHLIPYDQLPLR